MKQKLKKLLLPTLLAVVLILATLLGGCEAKKEPKTETDGDVVWSFDEHTGEFRVTGTGHMGNYPPEWDEGLMAGVDTRPWSEYVGSIRSVTIEEGVTGVGAFAFYNCNQLTRVSFPSTLKSIGTYAFARCGQLETIELPNELEQIGEFAFQAVGIASVTLPSGIKQIDSSAFCSNPKLTTVVFSEQTTLTHMGDSVFSYCPALTDITLPDCITTLPRRTFHGCASLQSITLPEGLTTIGQEAFLECTELVSVALPVSLTQISDGAFSKCESLEGSHCPRI